MAQLSRKGPIYLQAGSPIELVEQLQRMSSLAADKPLPAFMSLFAYRFEQLRPDQPLRTDCADTFISDLVRYGWIKLVYGTTANG